MSFNSREILSELSSYGFEAEVVALPCTTSTNDVARSMISKESDPLIVVADQQTKGKGSHGRSFFSPEDTGFYMTFSVPKADPKIQMTLTAGVATVLAIDEVCHKKVGIKWVNDLIYKGKKVCGILCERLSDGTVLVGIGINMMTPKEGFPPEIAETAAALGSDTGLVNTLAADIYRWFMDLIENNDRILTLYKEKCITIGQTVQFTYEGVNHIGLASDVDHDGSLIIVQDGVERKYSSGEISVRPV